MATRAQRRHHRRTPCVLCLEPIAGYRMELGATWVAHGSCFDTLADQLHAKGGLRFSTLPRRSDEFRQAVRDHLTRLAPQLARRRAARANAATPRSRKGRL